MSDQSTSSKDDSNRNEVDNSYRDPLDKSSCLLDQLNISVVDTEIRYSPGTVNLRESYTVYLIETKTQGSGDKTPENLTNIWRRYSEFETLKDYLQVTYPFIVTPPLPEKGVLFSWQTSQPDILSKDFIDRRKAGLENFLLRIAVHKVLSHDKVFLQFLQLEDAWTQSVATLGYLGKADAKWRSLSATFLLKKPDRIYEETKNYGNELHSNISSLLKIRSKLVGHQFGIHKLHENYGRIFAEWGNFEKQLGDSLPKVSQLLNAYANLSTCLEEEEQFVDQMKEYLFFADSLRFVCKKQEMLQYEVERVEDSLSAKVAQKENLMKGKVGFISRWFVNVDTDEVRELKLQQIDAQIQENETNRVRVTAEASKFVEKSQEGIAEFQEQKVKDLKESLILYAILQIKMCKKGLAVWSNMRDSFESI